MCYNISGDIWTLLSIGSTNQQLLWTLGRIYINNNSSCSYKSSLSLPAPLRNLLHSSLSLVIRHSWGCSGASVHLLWSFSLLFCYPDLNNYRVLSLMYTPANLLETSVPSGKTVWRSRLEKHKALTTCVPNRFPCKRSSTECNIPSWQQFCWKYSCQPCWPPKQYPFLRWLWKIFRIFND